jgi:hypothetical protein
MRCDRDNIGGGFENPSKGLHSFEVDDQPQPPGWVMKGEGDNAEATDTILVWAKVIDDEEEGRRIPTRFNLEKKGGRTNFATFLYYTKISAKLEKKFEKMDPDLNVVDWGEKYLHPDSKQAKNVTRTAISQLLGAKFDSEVTVRKDVEVEEKGEDGKPTGEKTKRDFSNLVPISFYGKGGKKKASKDDDDDEADEKPDKKSKKKEEEDDEDWD